MNNNLYQMGFFYISAPYLEKSRDASIRQIREVVIRKNTAQGKQITLERNKFKLANLDTLMLVNDKLLKTENLLESFLKKVDKQYLDLQEKQSHQWYVKGAEKELPVQKYLYDFRWNDSKYPRSFPIPRIAENLEIKLNGLENELRQKTNSFNEVKIQLSQSTTKEGNYYVRDLTDILVEPNVAPNDFIYTKFVTTVVVIVPVASQEEFMASIDMLTEYVVPYSAKKFKVPEKDGLSIWKVNLFTVKCQEEEVHHEDENEADKIKRKDKRNQTPIQEFIEKGRERLKVVVKEFKFETGLAESKKKKKDSLEQKLLAHSRALSDICLAYFSEGYELYAHAKILRLVIESNMRFGSDPTVFYLLESMPGKDKIVQTMLIEIFGDKENEGLYGTKDQIDDAEDFFPFIYVPVITL